MEDDGFIGCFAIVLMFLFLCLGAVCGGRSGKYQMQIQAVENGAAKWITASDGSTEFKWNEKGDSE